MMNARAGLAGLVAVVVAGLLAGGSGGGGVAAAGVGPGSVVVSPVAAAPGWLAEINSVRVGAGLGLVVEDVGLEAGLRAHVAYLAGTAASLLVGRWADLRTENPASPLYSVAGAAAGGSALLAWGARSDVDAIDIWLASPLHAVALLAPGLKAVGFARSAGGVAALDVVDGLDATVTAPTVAVLFPGDGATTGLPAYSGGEFPDPIQTCVKQYPGLDWSSPGLPVVAMLPAAPVAGLSASLSGPSGAVGSGSGGGLCVLGRSTFVTTDPVYGLAGANILAGSRAVVLIPRAPLVNGAYTATISQPGQADVTWSFTVAASLVNVTAPVVAGAPVVGGYVQVAAGGWVLGVAPVSAGVSYRYQWSAGGVPVAGATGASYCPMPADAGEALSVTVTASMPGYGPGSVTVSVPGKVAAGAIANISAPTVAGVARVGVRLTVASPGKWSSAAGQLAYSYQWYAGGVAVAGATGSGFTPGAAQAGKALSVKVTASAAGYASAAKSSAATGAVAKGALVRKARPALTGTVRVGGTLKVTTGVWSPSATVRVQWYAGGKAVKDATKANLKLTAAMRGKAVTVRLTATRPGYTTATVTLTAKTKVR
ncbi:MAG: hypothetical protein FWD74_00175 [Actinomycetia bacterium]|nr:hypothetical protein [Actinomycetes bacterium]